MKYLPSILTFVSIGFILKSCSVKNEPFAEIDSKEFIEYSYDFINQIMVDNSPSSKHKISSIKIDKELYDQMACEYFISSDDFKVRFKDTISEKDIQFMLSQCDTKIKSWDGNIPRLFISEDTTNYYNQYRGQISTLDSIIYKNLDSLEDIHGIWYMEMNNYKLKDSLYSIYDKDSLRSKNDKLQELKKELYGNSFISYSHPIFSINGEYAIVTIAHFAAPLLANGTIYVYHLEEGKWVSVYHQLAWIS